MEGRGLIGRVALAAAAAGVALATGPTTAAADHHRTKITELHRGDANTPSYIELQMYRPGQNQVAGREILTFDQSGQVGHLAIPPPEPAFADNQRTILIAGPGPALSPPADITFLGSSFDPGASGAVCLSTNGVSAVDCVSYGSPSPAVAPPSPVGSPVAPGGLAPGQSVHRTIARKCATLLEAVDDTDDSAADFTLGPPSPRPNTVAPTEVPCGRADRRAPNTRIKSGPEGRIEKRTAKVAFKSTERGSTFECKLDRDKYKPCRSPKKLKDLDEGRHKFKVRATDAAGNTDPSPAKLRFTVVGQ